MGLPTQKTFADEVDIPDRYLPIAIRYWIGELVFSKSVAMGKRKKKLEGKTPEAFFFTWRKTHLDTLRLTGGIRTGTSIDRADQS